MALEKAQSILINKGSSPKLSIQGISAELLAKVNGYLIAVSGGDSDAQAFITAAAITDPTQETAINDLVVGLKADGLWSKMKAIYPIVGGTASSHKFNLKDPQDTDAAFRLTFSGGWTHSATGAKPNGTNGFADTHFIPINELASNVDASLSFYSRTDGNANSISIGAEFAFLIQIRNGGKFYPQIGSTAQFPSFTNPDGLGYYSANRHPSNSLNIEGYKNGARVVNGAEDVGLVGISVTIGKANGGSRFSYRECAFATMGYGLTVTEQANFYTRVQAFQTALSRQV